MIWVFFLFRLVALSPFFCFSFSCPSCSKVNWNPSGGGRIGQQTWEKLRGCCYAMGCCIPVRPKGFRSGGASGCVVKGRVSDQRLDVGVWVWAYGCGRLLLYELDLTSEGKGLSRSGLSWAELGWARGERPAPSRCETGLATVGLIFLPLFLFVFLSYLFFP